MQIIRRLVQPPLIPRRLVHSNRSVSQMASASASRVALDTAHCPVYAVPKLTQTSADKTSELLQLNHDKHHVYFNDAGFHNHIVHHQLTLYALGAPVDVLESQYKHNASYQRPAVDVHPKAVKDMQDYSAFKSYLGKEDHYPDFLVHFQREIDSKGWQATLREYLFKRDERADDLLVRMFAGFLHPIIHLGFGVEFEQPAIIAEALAQAAVHNDWESPLLLNPEKLASEADDKAPSPTLLSLVRRAREQEALANCAQGVDGNKLRDGLLKRAVDPYAKLAAEYSVSASTMQAQLAEMIQTNAIFCFASSDPKYIFKTDFFYIHCLNCSIFFPRFLEADWLDEADKIRLLEWKGRSDLAMYISRGAPELRWDEVTGYHPKVASDDWQQIFGRAFEFEDDGHVAKLLRALANGSRLTASEQVEEVALSPEHWRIMALMAIDSAESNGPTFVRNTGMQRAWVEVPLRSSEVAETAKLT